MRAPTAQLAGPEAAPLISRAYSDHASSGFVAHVWAEQEHLFEKAGRRMPVEDSYIAATARRHGLTLFTGNDRDFRRPGLKVFNPFKELPSA